MTNGKTAIRVALDWTPNTLHSGLFLAQHHNLYSDAGLTVELLPPAPSYATSPGKRLETNEVDLAICPSESVIAYAESAKPNFQLQAIYAILQKDASAIVTTKDHISRARDLEDAVYGSYNARYEDAIVRSMITADGGDGSKMRIERQTEKLSLFEELKKRGTDSKIDATWVFLPWEGVEAEMECVALRSFRTKEYGVPYGYSPVIARNAAANQNSRIEEGALKMFVDATRRGYEMCVKDPDAAVEVMKGKVEGKSEEFLGQSQREVNEYYSDGSRLGSMDGDKWEAWLKWLKEKKLVEKQNLEAHQLFTNEFLG